MSSNKKQDTSFLSSCNLIASAYVPFGAKMKSVDQIHITHNNLYINPLKPYFKNDCDDHHGNMETVSFA